MLGARSLALVNGYNPGLSGAWMLQRAMSIPAGQAAYREEFINRLLAENFKVGLGGGAMREGWCGLARRA